MKKLLFALGALVLSVSTSFAMYTPSAALDAKIDVVEELLVETLLSSSESTAMAFVDVLHMYEDRFMSEGHERNLYIVQELMYDIVPMVHCLFNDGVYLTGVRECEGLDMETCEMKGGMFYECGSACRNDPEGSICTLQCVQYCDMMPEMNDEVEVAVDDMVDMEDDMIDMEGEMQEWLIDSMKVSCTGMTEQECLQITRVDNQTDLNTVLFYDTIHGLDYKEGFRYRVRVNITQLDNVPADASSMKVDLVTVISETVDGDVCSHYNDGCNDCIVTMNDAGEYVSACTRMACAQQGAVECTMFRSNFISPETSAERNCESNSPLGASCFN